MIFIKVRRKLQGVHVRLDVFVKDGSPQTDFAYAGNLSMTSREAAEFCTALVNGADAFMAQTSVYVEAMRNEGE